MNSIFRSLFHRFGNGRAVPANGRAPAAVGSNGLLDREALIAMQDLEFISRNVVDGLLSGRHRSTHRGGCCEFAQHRPYSAGDEIRLIDWQIVARSDRYYVRQFEEETNAHSLMIVDASGSMRFGLSTPTKLQFACRAVACLSRLFLRQRDATGVAVVNHRASRYIPPRQKPLHLQAILQALALTEADGPTRLAQQVRACSGRLTRRGIVLIFSDCFTDVAELGTALRTIRARGHDAALFHIVAPEEVSFTFRHWSTFESLEIAGDRLDIDPASIRDEYLRQFNTFVSDLQTQVASAGCDYIQVQTDMDLGSILARYLKRRAGSGPRQLHYDEGEVAP